MRKVLSIPDHDLPYHEEQGLFFVAPYVRYSPFYRWDYEVFRHRSIVVVPEDEVELHDLVGYPEDEPEWVSFWSHEGSYEVEEFFDLPLADIPMYGVLILEGGPRGRKSSLFLGKFGTTPSNSRKEAHSGNFSLERVLLL
jgi:hypothetical protein